MQTSRPSVISPSNDLPYAPDFASNIAQSLCRQENIQHVIFVGQADGSAIAVLAAASSRRSVLRLPLQHCSSLLMSRSALNSWVASHSQYYLFCSEDPVRSMPNPAGLVLLHPTNMEVLAVQPGSVQLLLCMHADLQNSLNPSLGPACCVGNKLSPSTSCHLHRREKPVHRFPGF